VRLDCGAILWSGPLVSSIGWAWGSRTQFLEKNPWIWTFKLLYSFHALYEIEK
jgi:hypothetical protein